MPMPFLLRLPLLRAPWAPLVARASSSPLVWLAPQAGRRPGMLGAALAEGVLAAWLGSRLGLAPWWWPINLAFLPALAALYGQPIPAWLPLAGFVLLGLLNWNALGERVPLYLSGRRAEAELAARLRTLPDDFRFVDLGCGLSGLLVRLSRRFPQARFVGVETAPLPFLLSWLRSLLRPNCQVRLRSLWGHDLASYDVVYCFLSPAPMPALWEKARAQMKPGAWLVSNTFEIPGVAPAEVVALGDWRDSRLLFWRPGDAARARG